MLLKHLFLGKLLKLISMKIAEVHEYRRQQWIRATIRIKLIVKFSVQMRRFGGIESKLISHLRNVYTFQNQIMDGKTRKGNTYRQAAEIIRSAL